MSIFDDIDLDTQQAAWDKLIDEIVKGNVIPLIGPDILIEEGNVHTEIVKGLSKKFHLSDSLVTFSELVYDHDFLKQVKDAQDTIYWYLNQLLKKARKFRPATILKDLLEIKQFPFIIVTSFTPIVEDVMREVWGNELRVLKFNNNPSENDDISSETDLRKPTVYYMFGKAGDSAHRYALTDTDMLDFCSSWLGGPESRPEKFVQIIKDKYLLMLGNNYSDWLYRFIWYSIRKSGTGEGLAVKENLEDGLTQFLERNHTFMCKNPQEVIQEIKKRLQEKLIDKEKKKFDSVERGVDIFISYSRSDSVLADKLYYLLSAEGKRVWYDKKNIAAAADFRKEIKEGINCARYFVPILSKNVENERNDPHFYRIEWDAAGEMSKSMGRTFIIPVAEKGFSYRKAVVNERIERHNAIEYSEIDDMKEVVQQIIHIINQA